MTIETPPPGGDKGWHSADHAALVGTKAWKGPDDVLRDYARLESHVGVSPDQLIKLPAKDKIDDAFRASVFERIGYNPSRAPAKPEDYGVNFEGAPPEFSSGLAALAHKHGISVDAMKELAEFNQTFGKTFGEKAAADAKAADDARWADRHGFAEGKLKERFGDKYEATNELMTREAIRLGFKDAADLEAYERNLALGGDEDLLRFRGVLADIADLRREAPMHKGGNGGTMTAQTARETLAAKSKDPEWGAKALTRGTPEAEENLRLNMLANGGTFDDAEIQRMAKGLTAQAAA